MEEIIKLKEFISSSKKYTQDETDTTLQMINDFLKSKMYESGIVKTGKA